MKGPVVVTGLGAVSSLGTGVSAILAAMRDGTDGITTMERFDLAALHPVHLSGWIRERWARGEPADLEAWAIDAAMEAWSDAGCRDRGIPPERIAIVLGTTIGEAGSITRVTEAVGEALGARGPRITISTACSSSTNAIGLGRDLLLSGDADVVLAGGAEKLIAEIFAGFAALGVLGAEKCAPFGETVGTTLGEGAGFVVLERASGAPRRVHACIAGYGLSSDAWHETTPDPRGDGIARAIVSCLGDSGLDARQVDYVNAHATGTAANDDSEWRGVQRALGPRALTIPISGSKGFFGHAQGAAGVLEAIATIACMRERWIPPSARVGKGRLRGPKDTVGETGRVREGGIGIALSNSAAFGGANAVVAIAREPIPTRASIARPVWITGLGRVATEAGAPRDERAIAAACGDVDLRTTDPSSRFVIAAMRQAISEAEVRVTGALRDRTGIFGGASGPPRASVDELEHSLERGLEKASAPAFARTVGHAPIGSAARAFGARGPATTVAADGIAGLFAIVYAARWLERREDCDVIVAGGLDERLVGSTGAEGAALVVLSTLGPTPGACEVRVAGTAAAGTEEGAIAVALARAGRGQGEVDVRSRPHASTATSLESASACSAAVEAIRHGARVVVASATGRQGAVAVVLVGEAAAGERVR